VKALKIPRTYWFGDFIEIEFRKRFHSGATRGRGAGDRPSRFAPCRSPPLQACPLREPRAASFVTPHPWLV